jgi:SAM-dependent methyltransferase
MPRDLDALTSPTLKHLREHWWNDAFSGFLSDALLPKPGKRILDVGCGTGTAEAALVRLRVSQLKLVGVDRIAERVKVATGRLHGMNARVGYTAGDACHLPFPDQVFDATFCVAVLQHIRDVREALLEFARVTRPGGRIVAVEPDNTARYWFTSVQTGTAAFDLGRRFFGSLASAHGEPGEAAVGPLVAGMFVAAGLELLSVDLFPVSVARLGPQPPALWESRRSAIRAAIDRTPDPGIQRLGSDYLKAIEAYAADAAAAGPAFVEIQNTMLFATVAERASD